MVKCKGNCTHVHLIGRVFRLKDNYIFATCLEVLLSSGDHNKNEGKVEIA